MSLVSTYVRAVDGQLYRNPIIYGDGWFVCFDDDDPMELVVFERTVWPDLNWLATICKRLHAIRGVPPKWLDMKPATSYWCRLTKRIPVPQDHSGIVKREEITQGVIIDLKGDVGT